MALLTDKFLFLHIPKTGGSYVRECFKALGISGREIFHEHAFFPAIERHISRAELEGKLVICFIRNPVTWYKSRWSFRMQFGWRMENPLDFNCASNDFNIFVNNCIDYAGGDIGWATKKMLNYIDSVPNYLKLFIGKAEYLEDDLLRSLVLSGSIEESVSLPKIPKINVCKVDGIDSQALATYDATTYKRMLECDGDFIRKFYPELSKQYFDQ